MFNQLKNKFFNLGNLLLPDTIAERLFGLKLFFYLVGGALVGIALDNGLSSARIGWQGSSAFFVGLCTFLLITAAGLLSALIGKEAEDVDILVARSDSTGSYDFETLRRKRREWEIERYPEVKTFFLGAVISLIFTGAIFLIFKPDRPKEVKHPTIYSFECDPCDVILGRSSWIKWSVDGADKVYLNNDKVSINGSMQVFPKEAITYRLHAINEIGEAALVVRINVIRPTPTPTDTPSVTYTPSTITTQTPNNAIIVLRIRH